MAPNAVEAVVSAGPGDAAAPADDDDVVEVSFSHVQIFVDHIFPSLEPYLRLQDDLDRLAEFMEERKSPSGEVDVEACRRLWARLSSERDDDDDDDGRAPSKRHPCLIRQLLSGFGFRIFASRFGDETRSVAIRSPAEDGQVFVLTSLASDAGGSSVGRDGHGSAARPWFRASRVREFRTASRGRAGVGALSFRVARGGVAKIRARYEARHPALLPDDGGGGERAFEARAWYAAKEGETGRREPDRGVRLRFAEGGDDDEALLLLPGLIKTEEPPRFPPDAQPAYADHWVSNVEDREGFLAILKDVLGFLPAVEFNAGVIAAGEAEIESTVAANRPSEKPLSQVYLPVNNAVGEAGHVKAFLKEIGPGVQHLASRVLDLPALVRRARLYASVLEGSSGGAFDASLGFLRVPRSYYGTLSSSHLARSAAFLTAEEAREVAEACFATGAATGRGDVGLSLTRDDARVRLAQALRRPVDDFVVDAVLRSRYSNLYELLGGTTALTEEEYLEIVRNEILVDVQGDDLLLQIFTTKILQRNATDEAPFLEFIQRNCSALAPAAASAPAPARLRPGCGGFGVRNFLALFLSVEIANARDAASVSRTPAEAAFHARRAASCERQLDESDPILAAAADAARREAAAANAFRRTGEEVWERRRREAEREKEDAGRRLKECAAKYADAMRRLRQDYEHGPTNF